MIKPLNNYIMNFTILSEINPEIMLFFFTLPIFLFISFCSLRIARLKKEFLILFIIQSEEFIKDLKIFTISMILSTIFFTIELLACIFIGFEFPIWVMLLYVPIALFSSILLALVFFRWYKRLRW